MKKYMACNVEKTREYILIHGEDYVNSVLASHGWLVPTAHEKSDPKEPMSPSMVKQVMAEKGEKDVTAINILQRKHQFKYRTLLGELIFYMILCRFDIITALTILSYFADCPANIHFVAIRKLAIYCRGTKRRGLLYWRCRPLFSLPPGDIPRPDLKTSPDLPYPSHPLSLGVYFDTSYAPYKLLLRK